MKLIFGLGNPGKDYASTRHNVGWWILDRFATHSSFSPWSRDFDSMVTSRAVDGTTVRLVKPLTYMNLSGAALRPYLKRPDFSVASDFIVVVDDVALPLGEFRLRSGGSAGGHNGLRSIEQTVASPEYARLRIGVRPEREEQLRDLADFVLSPFSKGESNVLEELAPRLLAALDSWIHEGILSAMNKHNRKTPPTE